MKTYAQRLFVLLSLFVVVGGPVIQPVMTQAQEPSEQSKLIGQRHINYFNLDSCTNSDSPAEPTAGTGKPDGATFPNLDPDQMATSINNFIKKENSNSELNGLGSIIVASAKNSNINPFLIVAIAHQESGLADPSDFNVKNGHNAFGRSAAAGQPSFQGARSWYKWTSAKASVDYTADENKNAKGGGDMATYLAEQYKSDIATSDIIGLFLKYAPAGDGNDPAAYAARVKTWISGMADNAGSSTAAAADGTPVTSADNASCECPSSASDAVGSSSDDKVTTFLQALAFQENGGAVVGTSGTGAQGKFQYIDSTWQSSAAAYYPPAAKYASANSAPESVQDAVAYLEYTVKFKKFNGDITKIAISHFYPVANTDPSKLDIRPPGNVITPRQYAESVIKHIKNGDGKSISFKFKDAPEFDKWLAKAGGAAGTDITAGAGASADSTCSCATPDVAPAGDTIVLDPGHSPTISESSRDTTTGLFDYDYENEPEMKNAYTASQKIKKILEAKGYTVYVTKKSADEKISLSDRAERANKANGALEYTMHSNEDGVSVLMYPDDKSSRSPIGGTRKDGTDGLAHPAIASKSESLAKTMAPVIAAGISKSYTAKSFFSQYGANGLAGNKKNSGNTPVQTILSSIPEVYSEVAESVLPTDAYAQASADAIMKVVKPAAPAAGASADPSAAAPVTAAADPGCGSVAAGTVQAIVDTAIKYAWPDGPHGITKNAAYTAAIAAHPKEYKGGCDGADCGAFVTRVMRDSGADPNYNKAECNTVCQKQYLDDHPGTYKNLGPQTSTKNLQPGDIAITRDTHTYIYVGPISDHPKFKGNAASASQCDRSPNASNTYFTDGNGVAFTWYRLIK